MREKFPKKVQKSGSEQDECIELEEYASQVKCSVPAECINQPAPAAQSLCTTDVRAGDASLGAARSAVSASESDIPTESEIAHAAEYLSPAEKVVHAGNARMRLVTVLLVVFILVAFICSLMLGRFPIEVDQAFSMMANRITQFFANTNAIEPTWTAQAEALFFNVRMPRIIMALLVGCCLAAAGAAFQGVFQNPLASPDILGASQGAALGAAIAILVGMGSFGISAFAFAFSMFTVLLVLMISNRAKGNRILVTVLAGVMVSSLFSAGVSFAKLVADPADQLPAITYWLMGSLTSIQMKDVLMALPFMAVGLVVLFVMRWRINILTMGDDEAATMGVNARRIRLVVTLAATLVTAASVAVTGMIGWVGLVIPHLCRMVVGCDYRKLMPTSMLMGAGFLLIVDDVSRLLTTAEIPIGILTAFIGAPFFLYLITRKKKI